MTTEFLKETWHVCRLCNKKITDLAKIYGGCGIYYTQVFKKHIEIDHKSTLEEYFSINNERPICPCGVCNKPLSITDRRNKLGWKKYACGRNPGMIKWAEEAKESRKGTGNPMYNKIPWNNGLSKETSASLMQTSKKLKGKKASQETRQKQSESAKKRIIHGHTGRKHSKEARQKMRERTLERIKNGDFVQLKSKPHKMMAKILSQNNIKFEEEFVLDYWSFDFKLYNGIYIEVDGDYFHSNPKFYPDGPISKTQKINYARDISKNKYCKKNNINLLRFWENDILNRPEWVAEQILCNMKK